MILGWTYNLYRSSMYESESESVWNWDSGSLAVAPPAVIVEEIHRVARPLTFKQERKHLQYLDRHGKPKRRDQWPFKY